MKRMHYAFYHPIPAFAETASCRQAMPTGRPNIAQREKGVTPLSISATVRTQVMLQRSNLYIENVMRFIFLAPAEPPKTFNDMTNNLIDNTSFTIPLQTTGGSSGARLFKLTSYFYKHVAPLEQIFQKMCPNGSSVSERGMA